ncbi:MAG: hypothetical protein ACREYB_07085, partial [Casimicrobiaceae bacterium]
MTVHRELLLNNVPGLEDRRPQIGAPLAMDLILGPADDEVNQRQSESGVGRRPIGPAPAPAPA